MSWRANPISDILGRVAKRASTVYKTVNRADHCYFTFNHVSEQYTIKCNDEGLVEIIYKPSTGRSFYMNYDSRNDTLTMYYTNRYSGGSGHSAPDGITNFTRCRKICTEEGYFMEMTRQDLTVLPMDAIIAHIEFCDTILEATRRIRNAKASTTV